MKKEKVLSLQIVMQNYLAPTQNLTANRVAFFTTALPGAFKTKVDYSFGMKRTEYHCVNCGAQHGHVFDDGPGENGKRSCHVYVYLNHQVK